MRAGEAVNMAFFALLFDTTRRTLKEIVHPKWVSSFFCHHLLILILFQTYMTFCLLLKLFWNPLTFILNVNDGRMNE